MQSVHVIGLTEILFNIHGKKADLIHVYYLLRKEAKPAVSDTKGLHLLIKKHLKVSKHNDLRRIIIRVSMSHLQYRNLNLLLQLLLCKYIYKD